MRTLDQWLDEYALSHRHPVNKMLHWICVPLIVLALLGLLASLPIPAALSHWPGGWASAVAVAALIYYTRLSTRLALGMLPVFALLGIGVHELSMLSAPLWLSSLVIFGIAWIGQFIGHAIEKQRPSFLKDLQFLLIGPLWLLAAAYRRATLRY
ncbi:MAG: Mpo1-like protein [Pseudomonadota bacterium]